MYSFLVALLSLFSVINAVSISLEPQTGDVPVPHAGGTMAVSNGKLVKLFGFYECFDVAYCEFIYEDAVYERDIDDPSGKWEKFTPTGPGPEPRVFTIANTDESDGSIVIFGGNKYNAQFNQLETFDDVWKYFPSTHRWRQVRTRNDGPGKRTGAYGRIKDGNLIIFGGIDENFVSHNDVWSLNIRTRTWTLLDADDLTIQEVSTHKPSVRYLHRAEIMGDSLFIFDGNFNPAALGVQRDDLWEFNLNTKVWTKIERPESILNRVHGASAIWGDNFVHIGGDVNDDENECRTNQISGGHYPTTEIVVWNRQTGWRVLAEVENSFRAKRIAATQYGPYLYIHGGFDFFCDPVPCADGTKCYNRQTSYPVWNQYLYRFDLRQV